MISRICKSSLKIRSVHRKRKRYQKLQKFLTYKNELCQPALLAISCWVVRQMNLIILSSRNSCISSLRIDKMHLTAAIPFVATSTWKLQNFKNWRVLENILEKLKSFVKIWRIVNCRNEFSAKKTKTHCLNVLDKFQKLTYKAGKI